MQPTENEKLAAAVFAIGLSQGFLRREHVVQWADKRITEANLAPQWLIDLSLSQQIPLVDLISDLNRIAESVDHTTTCKAIYSLLPDVSDLTFDQAADFTKRLYRITYACLNGDWSNKWLHSIDQLADDFQLLRDGLVSSTQSALIKAVQKFAQDHRNDALRKLLHPAQWIPCTANKSMPR